MAMCWPTQGFEGRTFELWVHNKWVFNFCVRSTPVRGKRIGWEEACHANLGIFHIIFLWAIPKKIAVCSTCCPWKIATLKGRQSQMTNGTGNLPYALKPQSMCVIDLSALPFARKSSLFGQFYPSLYAALFSYAHAYAELEVSHYTSRTSLFLC